ncbi:MAG: hypothetical protein KKG92_13350 [Gammaproteobacteria bacterium]|nr:hypothetical protein [Gammaproteobacteria bacterium]
MGFMIRRVCFGGILVALLCSRVGLAWGVELIVHPGVSAIEVSRPLARLIFGAKVTRWEDGSAVRVFVLPDESLLHQEMSKGILDLYPYQLRTAWDRVIYTGIGQAPVQVANESEMRKQVASVPGAIGYLGRVQKNDKVRALLVR